ncbi:MAG: universal stress protein [Bacteroidetes bacterium]|nr:universal stress protein [Bacteroidota bacterium]
MKKILVPTDGSPLGDYAYNLAHQIAEKVQADIEILSIVPAPPDSFFDMNGEIKSDEGENLSHLLEQKEKLEREINDWAKEKKDITQIRVKIGRVDEDIVQYATERKADLIVMGTGGATGVDEWIRSTHAAHIVRTSPVPVLTLKCDRSLVSISHLLLVGGFDKPEEMDLKMVRVLQQAFHSTIHLLRINTPGDFETNRNITSNMTDFVTANQLENVEMHVYCEETIEKGIENFCKDSHIDFVLMGTHQRKGLSRLFKKSISENVVNHVWQPIMTFHVH